MEIKVADDKQPQIEALTALLARTDLDAPTRKRIDQEIWNIRTGAKGEREAAYEIEFHCRNNRNVMTIHDLRIECDGRVAQIDHLVITRLFEIWVCESKWFSEGVSINDHAEWVAYYGSKPRGIASPIEQNKRHIAVLNDVFARGLAPLPKRLGLTMRPTVKSVVLVANSARIGRPRRRVEGVDTVIKCEQLIATIDKSWDTKSVTDVLLTLVGQETIEKLARDLVKLHVPGTFDWAAKFGLSKEVPAIPLPGPATERRAGAARVASAAQVHETMPSESPGGICESCGKAMSAAEVAYCRTNAKRFSGRVLCFTCQRRVPRRS